MKAYRKAKELESKANKDVLNGVGKIAGIQGADILLNSTQQNTKAFGGSILKGGGGLYDDTNKKNREAVTTWAKDLSRFVTTVPEAIVSLFNGGAPPSGTKYGGGIVTGKQIGRAHV